MENNKLINTLDHLELINWIHYMSYSAAKIGETTLDIMGKGSVTLPSGQKVKITIQVEQVDG
jgi:hypothetical protein